MKNEVSLILNGNIPFCIIQKQDSEDVLVLSGKSMSCEYLSDIPRKKGLTGGKRVYDTISIVPFCQIQEKGYKAIDGGEKILTIQVHSQFEVDIHDLLEILPSEQIHLNRDITYDCKEEEYRQRIRDIVDKEIGNGEGANFVVPRNGRGKIDNFSVTKALTIFKNLLETDYGTYWKFIFYDTHQFFIGSTPERHLLVEGGKVKMNPISGTFRKTKNWARRKDFKTDLMGFLTDEKEINELFMVVDEELKMMARMCDQGGTIVGPVLKEMSQLIHSEYLLAGESDKDIIELFRLSMFAATVVGSPVGNACNIIAKYSSTSRRYYGSALLLVGRDEKGRDSLDSPITIRTLEIDQEGNVAMSVGATLVRDSVAEDEVKETLSKSGAILASLDTETIKLPKSPQLPGLHNDDEIIETLARRNRNLSHFWFYKQNYNSMKKKGYAATQITLIHNQDDFIYMLQHMINCMGIRTQVIPYEAYDVDQDHGDITLLGPGPGNPNQVEDEKISRNIQIASSLLQQRRVSLFVCLGHQILCKTLGYEVIRKKSPLQGVQVEVDLFGRKERVGFYNTFVPQFPGQVAGVEFATGQDKDELIAIRGDHYIGYQFHPESLLTQHGFAILEDTIDYLLPG